MYCNLYITNICIIISCITNTYITNTCITNTYIINTHIINTCITLSSYQTTPKGSRRNLWKLFSCRNSLIINLLYYCFMLMIYLLSFIMFVRFKSWSRNWTNLLVWSLRTNEADPYDAYRCDRGRPRNYGYHKRSIVRR